MMIECPQRGPNHIKRLFQNRANGRGLLGTHFVCFSALTLYSEVSGKLANAIRMGCAYRTSKERTAIVDVLLKASVFENSDVHELQHLPRENSYMVRVIACNLDNGIRYTMNLYRDVTLAWWLKLYACCSYNNQSPGVTASTRYLRAVHGERSLFLSSSGKKTFRELGIEDGDKISVGGIDPGLNTTVPKALREKPKTFKSRNKRRPKGMRRKRPTNEYQTPELNQTQVMEKHRQTHSLALSRVLDELGPMLKDIRISLNDLTLQKSKPKVKQTNKTEKREIMQPASMRVVIDDCFGGKAGKIEYQLYVGDVASLYKTPKVHSDRLITIDLHGHSKDEAFEKLDGSLPLWIDAAMKGEYPWVIPVNIICGRGSQILSEAVRHWVQNRANVANRPKGS